MLKIIGIVALVVVVLLAALLIFASTKPDTFRVERAATIEAPPGKVFPLINDFEKWRAWSPWEKKDPAMKRTMSGVTKGEGAVYEWEGDKNVGKGRMEITQSTPPSRVIINLDFVRPFEAHNIVEFTLKPRGGDATNVIWAMHGPMPYVSKVISVFFSMDSMIGKDFETGLANLKRVAES
jgi:uncharacterized protein YndB with AHSA1/START domain